MLSNIDIENYVKKDKNIGKKFIGVFSRDMLPKKRKVGFYIINMQPHDDGDGSHWVMAYEKPNNTSVYADSFGVVPPKSILNYFSKPMYVLDKQLQDYDSDMCGYFCIYMVQQLNNKKSLNDIVTKFYEDTKYNDDVLRKHFNI